MSRFFLNRLEVQSALFCKSNLLKVPHLRHNLLPGLICETKSRPKKGKHFQRKDFHRHSKYLRKRFLRPSDKLRDGDPDCLSCGGQSSYSRERQTESG